MEELKASELELGDVVCCPGMSGAWSTAVVIRIEPDAVTLFRPYATTADFSYSSGSGRGQAVIPYIGTEQFPIFPSDTVRRLERALPKR